MKQESCALLWHDFLPITSRVYPFPPITQCVTLQVLQSTQRHLAVHILTASESNYALLNFLKA